MFVDKESIEVFLQEAKKLILKGRYQISKNKKRQDNIRLFTDYIIDEEGAKQILLDLDVMDFSEILHNDHDGYEDELLYVFGKKVRLAERYGDDIKDISLYIKINKIDDRYIVIVSLHEQKFPLKYYFK